MTTVALLRTNHVNLLVRRADGDTTPWTDAQIDKATTDALTQLWQDGVGKRVSGSVATSQASDVYTIPAGFAMPDGVVSTIELIQTAGGVTQRVGRATRWRQISDTQVRVTPRIATDSTLTLLFTGWTPFNVTGSDLPVRLENIVAMKSAALCYGQELGQLANSQLQQGLDQGRVVDYPTAVGMSAYWERRYRDAIDGDRNLRSLAPRFAHAR